MGSATRVAQRFRAASAKLQMEAIHRFLKDLPDSQGGYFLKTILYTLEDEAEPTAKQLEVVRKILKENDRPDSDIRLFKSARLRLASVGETTYPKDHTFGQKVPKGGSACSKCRFISEDGKHCASEHFRSWHKSMGAKDPSLIPEPADQYCCDVFES